jgi:pimeloyl-ACP methyl ester carboxylesterase
MALGLSERRDIFARLAQTRPTMPVLSIGGEKANGELLGRQVKLVVTNAAAVTLPGTGHWVMEERPQETSDALVRSDDSVPGRRGRLEGQRFLSLPRRSLWHKRDPLR